MLQGQSIRQFVGTVGALKAETAEIVVKPDVGEAVSVKVTGSSTAQRIAPGERDLKNSKPIQVSDVAVGDRVLVALEPGTTDLRRIVVMAASDIASKDEADRQDWIKRGVSGTVREVKAGAVTITVKGMAAEQGVVVSATPATKVRRYPGDSVKFAEAKPETLAKVQIGDQLRARGEKGPDGLKVSADDIVFGTFQTRVGSVVSFNQDSKTLVLAESGTGKTFTVRVGPDAQIKSMPDFGALMQGGGMPGGGGRGMPGGAPVGAPGGAPGGGMPDIGRMVEMMPAGTVQDFQPGKTVIVSSTKTANPDQLTAITMVVNADMLIQMARMMSGNGMPGGRGAMPNSGGMPGGMGGMQSGMSGMGIDLAGITP